MSKRDRETKKLETTLARIHKQTPEELDVQARNAAMSNDPVLAALFMGQVEYDTKLERALLDMAMQAGAEEICSVAGDVAEAFREGRIARRNFQRALNFVLEHPSGQAASCLCYGIMNGIFIEPDLGRVFEYVIANPSEFSVLPMIFAYVDGRLPRQYQDQALRLIESSESDEALDILMQKAIKGGLEREHEQRVWNYIFERGGNRYKDILKRAIREKRSGRSDAAKRALRNVFFYPHDRRQFLQDGE